MYVDFESLSGTSRIWVYQSSRELSENEVVEMSHKLERFIEEWTRHGDDL